MARTIRKMTPQEQGTHNDIYIRLKKEGSSTYARLFKELYLYIDDIPNCPAYMDTRTGAITIDRSLASNQICTIVRHEILHGFLKHGLRMRRKLAYDLGEDPDKITNKLMKKINYLMMKYRYDFNYAADYEISNLAYTEKDKEIIRAVIYHGRTVPCLVTEDQHPEWIGYTMEEMFDELQELRKQDESNHIAEDDGESFADIEYDPDNKDSIPPRPGKNSPSTSGNFDDDEGSDDGDTDATDGGSNDDSDRGGDGGFPGKGKSSNKKPPVIFGTFVDKNTFLDRNGNPISFE